MSLANRGGASQADTRPLVFGSGKDSKLPGLQSFKHQLLAEKRAANARQGHKRLTANQMDRI